MGYASYLEDILGKANEYEHYLQDFNKTSKHKIDIHAVLSFRLEIESLLKKIKTIKNYG